MKNYLALVCIAALLVLPGCLAAEVFHETFESAAGVAANGGQIIGTATFPAGFSGNAASLSDHVRYARPENFTQGTIEFFFEPNEAYWNTNNAGLFDLGLPATDDIILYWTKYTAYGKTIVFGLKDHSGVEKQDWTPMGDMTPGWHHFAAVWKCGASGSYLEAFLDGETTGQYKYTNGVCNFQPEVGGNMRAGTSWCGSSNALLDEFHIYNETKSRDQILQENAPAIIAFSPLDETLRVNAGGTVDFSVTASDPHNASLTITWYLNNVAVGTGNAYHYTAADSVPDSVTAVVSNGVFDAVKGWAVIIPPAAGTYILNGKIYVDGEKFLVEGVDYAGYRYDYQGLPATADTVVDTWITYGGKKYVKDYNGDNHTQAWEMLRHDLETMKRVGANTIRTYASGWYHDKDLDNVNESGEEKKDNVPDWMYDQMIDFAEQNGMKVLIGYWIGDEAGTTTICNWTDFPVANKTLMRIVNKYGNRTGVLGWSIGNEVVGRTWTPVCNWGTVDPKQYMNKLYAEVREQNVPDKPILYGQYIGENVDFTTLDADILGPQAYVHPANELAGEFMPPPPHGKAYLMAEFGHLITQAQEHWDLAKQYAGGGFQEYNDILSKSHSDYAQDEMGLVEEYRKVKPSRYDVIAALYGGELTCASNASCDYLDRIYCDGALIKRDEAVCVDFFCQAQTTVTFDCSINDAVLCDGDDLVSNEYACFNLTCELNTSTLIEACDDGDACNGDESCNAGACAGGTALQCDDGLWCNGGETCDDALGCVAGADADCSGSNLPAVATCTNTPDGDPRTWDYAAGFTSVCDEGADACTTGSQTLTHNCNMTCGAECVVNGDCDDSNSNTLDTCIANCTCLHEDQSQPCTVPTDGMAITEDTTFCRGVYTQPVGVTIAADGVTLDCNSSVLKGATGAAITVVGQGVTVKNCRIQSSVTGILANGTSGINVIGNYFNYTSRPIYFEASDGCIVQKNRIEAANHAILILNSSNTQVLENFVDNMHCKFSGYCQAVLGEYAHNTTVMYNNFTRSSGSFVFYVSDGCTAKYNNINDSVWSIYLQMSNVSVDHNWWGTTNCSLLEGGIIDCHDYPYDKACANYEPFLDAPYPAGVPIYCDGAPAGCASDADCDDGDTLTEDTCLPNGTCTNEPLEQGLIFYEPFDGESTVAANDGVYALPDDHVFVQGLFGNAIDTSTHVIYPLPGNMTEGTLEMYFKPGPTFWDTTIRGFFDVGRMGMGVGSHLGVMYNNQYGYATLEIRNGTGGFWSPDTDWYPDLENGWHHLVVSWKCNSNSTPSLLAYLDGRYNWDYNYPYKCTFLPDTVDMMVGQIYWNGYFSDSYLDEVKIYDHFKPYSQVLGENSIAIKSHYPESFSLTLPVNGAVNFSVFATDPRGLGLTYTWYVNDEEVSSGVQLPNGSSYGFVKHFNYYDHLEVVVSNGIYESSYDWYAYLNYSCSDDGDCDDLMPCNGAETCDAGTCAAGVPVECDDGLWCNGEEACDDALGCVNGTPLDCSGYDLPVVASCNGSPDGDPMTWDYSPGFTSVCNESTYACTEGAGVFTHACNVTCGAECAVDGDCDDSNPSTLDECFACECVHVQEAGLLFYEPFENATEVAGNGGTVIGTATFVPGIFGNAVDASNYVEYPQPGSLTTGTIEFWFKPKDTFPGSRRGLFDVGRLSASLNTMAVHWDGSLMIFELKEDNSMGQNYKAYTPDSNWHHVVATWNCSNVFGDFLKIYLDGKAGSMLNYWSGNVCGFQPDSTLWIGATVIGAAIPSRSYIDEFRIFDVTKTQVQILEENAPALSVSPSGSLVSANVNGSVAFSANATDPHGLPVTFAWYLNGALVSTSGGYTYTATETGYDNVTVHVSNGVYTVSRSWELVVGSSAAGVSVSIVDLTPAPASYGGKVIWTLNVTNVGSTNITNYTAEEYVYPRYLYNYYSDANAVASTNYNGTTATRLSWWASSLGTLAPGQSKILHVNATMLSSSLAACGIPTRVQVMGTTLTGRKVAGIDYLQLSACPSGVKAFNLGSTAQGTNLTYKYEVRNTGLVRLDPVRIQVTLSSAVNFTGANITPSTTYIHQAVWDNIGPLEPGESVTLEVYGITKVVNGCRNITAMLYVSSAYPPNGNGLAASAQSYAYFCTGTCRPSEICMNQIDYVYVDDDCDGKFDYSDTECKDLGVISFIPTSYTRGVNTSYTLRVRYYGVGKVNTTVAAYVNGTYFKSLPANNLAYGDNYLPGGISFPWPGASTLLLRIDPDDLIPESGGLSNDYSLQITVAPNPQDMDGDGYKSPAYGGADCNDNDPQVHPGATEICDDAVDNDCDGDTDAADLGCREYCGNGVADEGEECDGSDLTGTCESELFDSGTISCRPDCFFDTSGCYINYGACNAPMNTSGEWVVSTAVACTGRIIIPGPNMKLVIQPGGKLLLEDSTFKLSPNKDGQTGITVEGGARFDVVRSTISSINDDKEFYFLVKDGARLSMVGSTLSEAGWSHEAGKKGLEVYSRGTRLLNSTFTKNARGASLYSNQNLIVGSTFQKNTYRRLLPPFPIGLDLEGSYNLVKDSEFTEQNAGPFAIGLSVKTGTKNRVEDNEFDTNAVALNFAGSGGRITGNSFSYQLGGIVLNGATGTVVSGNDIDRGMVGGILLQAASGNEVSGNTISYCGENATQWVGTPGFGIGLNVSDNNIVAGNTITNSYNASIAVGASSGNIVANNTLSGAIGFLFWPGVSGNGISGNGLSGSALGAYNNGPDAVDMGNNWWGTANCSDVAGIVFDYYDDASRGVVDYDPILDELGGSPLACVLGEAMAPEQALEEAPEEQVIETTEDPAANETAEEPPVNETAGEPALNETVEEPAANETSEETPASDGDAQAVPACDASALCNATLDDNGTVKYCRDMLSGYHWYSDAEMAPYCDSETDVGYPYFCNGSVYKCAEDLTWAYIGPEECVTDTERPCDTGLPGVCSAGVQTCLERRWVGCGGLVEAVEETCGDALDNDCDGETDEGC